ncbi:MAG: hypothetical protein ACE5EL_08490, partial [Anaerolineae bacterium]
MVRAHSPSRPAAHRPVAAAAGAVCAPLPVVPVLLALAAALATLLASPRTASSQRLFGQNKIQYEDFQWRVMKTPHVDLHFYPQEQQVACWVAEVAEEAVVEFGDAMQLELRKPIPFMLYSSPQAFQQ